MARAWAPTSTSPCPPAAATSAICTRWTGSSCPRLHRFRPDAIIVACGFDAAAVDPLGRMLSTAETFRQLTRAVMQAADRLCDGRLVLVHEGGYSEVYVPFCGHAVLEELSGAPVTAPDPLAATLAKRQPDARFDAFVEGLDRRGWHAALALTLPLHGRTPRPP